ncbi:hypothetical protein [Novosphingobium sp. CCH12-A3]|uniref:hypothetical protein n=1 Tax=Novosphingobium sp. CCH12-A3 TaxID=1768752 RepID=UPI00078496DE|nr:hypothetical protein [Novosphingobium sp. CCH12-A3]
MRSDLRKGTVTRGDRARAGCQSACGNGTFALDLFRKIHANLRAVYPEQAVRADQRIAAIHAQSDATRH